MPTSKELSSRISKMEKEIKKMKAKIEKDTESLFKLSFKEIFKKHKKLESFSWVQYTPHWNDGDECVFGAHTEYLKINGSEEDFSLYELDRLYKDLLNKEKAIKKLIGENQKLASKKDSKWQIESNERRIKELQEADFSEVEWKYLAIKDIAEVFSVVDDSTLKSMFDDHAKVTVTRDGIETESYEHD